MLTIFIGVMHVQEGKFRLNIKPIPVFMVQVVMRFSLFLIVIFLTRIQSHAQQIECQLEVSFAGHELDTIAGNYFGDTLLYVERLQFYLHASHDGKSNEKNAILLGMSQPTKHLLANTPFDLYLGVDSVLNYNGVHEGALDPINGMYWTWQTGYIHCKLEGNIICDSSRKSFEYHIGGYSTNDSGPFFIGHKSIGNELQVTLDIYPAIQWAMKKEVFRIMSPGKLSDQMAQAILNGISIR